jgi:putative membrane protein
MAMATLRFSQSANRMMSDNCFVTEAAQGGMSEVEMGKLAQSHSSNDKVKQFGQQMVDDHSKSNGELATIAGRKGITLPTNLDAKDQATMDSLAKLNGAEFDRAYMQDMVKDHREDIAEFKGRRTAGRTRISKLSLRRR